MSNGRVWLRAVIEPLRPVVREILGASLFVNILALAVPIFVMQVYDRVIGHSGIETLKGLFIGVMIMLAFDFVLRQSRGRILQTVALKLDVEIGERLFDKVSNLPLRTLESKPSSHWQQLFRDVDTVRNTLSGASAILLADLPFVVIFLGMVFIIGQPLAVVFVIAFAIFILLAWRSSRALSETAQREKGVIAARDALMAEMIAGRSIIKAAGLNPALRPLWEKRQAGAIEQAIQRGAISDGYVNLGMVLTLATTIMLTTVGALYIIGHELTMGALIACNMLSSRMYGPINQLVGAWRTLGSFREATDRLGEVFAESEDRSESAITRERPAGRLKVETITFHYDPAAAPTLAIDRLAIEPGGITAVVGRNGSGKSTLLKLLMGLYKPLQGRVVLDGADMAQFSRVELERWIGIVPQETVLFSGTIRDNIAFGDPLSGDERLLEAARAAGVHDAIVDMPDGYATEIGEAGARLSAGQRQRIAIARALVRDPPILLLDEPSASLDRQAEEALRATLLSLAANRTVVIVTHSAVLLPVCRDIVVLDKGKVAAAGPGSELLPMLFAPLPNAPPKQVARPNAVPSPQPVPAPQPVPSR